MTRYAVIDRSGQCTCVLVAQAGHVDCAPESIAYVRTLPLQEAIDRLWAAGLHLMEESQWLSQNG